MAEKPQPTVASEPQKFVAPPISSFAATAEGTPTQFSAGPAVADKQAPATFSAQQKFLEEMERQQAELDRQAAAAAAKKAEEKNDDDDDGEDKDALANIMLFK
jgi:hypothetical protein